MEQFDIQGSLAHLHSAEPAAICRLAALFRPIGLEPGQLLCGPGLNGRSLYLLSSGLLQHYRLQGKKEGRQTIELYLPGSFLGSPAMLLPPSQLDYIAAIVPCRLLAASQADIDAHCRLDPQGLQLVFAIQQGIISAGTALSQLLHAQPAALRRGLMCARLGPYLYQLPRQVLSSYLSMSRKHLGRLISSELRNRN